jgi:hypothetical protein
MPSAAARAPALSPPGPEPTMTTLNRSAMCPVARFLAPPPPGRGAACHRAGGSFADTPTGTRAGSSTSILSGAV